MKRPKLAVENRKVFGKKVKKLRKEGLFPANIYGKDIKSQAVQLPYKDFEKIFKEAGETSLVDVEVNGEAKPSLIHNVQIDPLTSTPLHADFYQVNLKEKVKTMVPLVVVGEPKAVTDKIGLLLQTISEIEVEALPEDLPEKIEVYVKPLAAVDEQLTVEDLKVAKEITVLTDPAQVVVKIGELVTKEAQEQAAAEQAAAQAAKAEGVSEEAAEAPAAETAQEKPEGEKEAQQAKTESPKEEKPQ